MKTYYRALPNTVVAPTENRYVMDFRNAFDWVEDVEKATEDYLDAARVTQTKLKEQLGLDAELVERKDPNLMESKYVLCRDA
jgi:hypothetical protein